MSLAQRMIQAGCAAFCLGAIAVATAAAPAAPAAAPDPNDTCLMCHSAADAKGAGGKSIAVDGAKFGTSVHGELKVKCSDCHTDTAPDKLPHADKLKPVNCATCHDKAAKEYAGTVHGVARKGGSAVAATCTDCHGTHDIKRAKGVDSRTNHANLEVTCGKCHGSDVMAATGKLPGGNIADKFHDSIHGKALKGAARAVAPTCTNCHGAHDIRARSETESRAHRARIPETCGSCHQQEREAYVNGMHGKLRQAGVLAAPGCADCHSAHSIQQHDKPSFQTEVIKECGNCHSDYISSYRDTFHGQVTALGYARVATCASCHGAHEILPAANPASKVSKQNRLQTCQGCHAGAGANFASFDPHANRHDRARDPIYYYAALFMEILLFGVFAFFGIHTLFWLYRELRVKFAGGGRRDERH